MNRWESRNGGHYCTVHDAAFERGEVCVACVVEPGTAPGEDKPDDPDARGLKIREAEFRTRAKQCWRIAAQMFGEPGEETTDRDVNAACKASAEAAKWERLALEVRDRYAPKQETDELIREYRKLQGKDGSN